LAAGRQAKSAKNRAKEIKFPWLPAGKNNVLGGVAAKEIGTTAKSEMHQEKVQTAKQISFLGSL